jgi:adenine phosphoribosyltransferase
MSVPKIDFNDLRSAIRDVPDFPKQGIVFKDITTLLLDTDKFHAALEAMADRIRTISFDAIAAIEARGFIFGAALARQLNKSLVLIRKPGKLPAATFREIYELEYGTDSVEMHRDALTPGSRVLIVDDLLATGGTALAACRLIEQAQSDVAAVLFLIELQFLDGRNILKGYDVISMISYDAE